MRSGLAEDGLYRTFPPFTCIFRPAKLITAAITGSSLRPTCAIGTSSKAFVLPSSASFVCSKPETFPRSQCGLLSLPLGIEVTHSEMSERFLHPQCAERTHRRYRAVDLIKDRVGMTLHILAYSSTESPTLCKV